MPKSKVAKKTHWTEAEVFRKLSGPFPAPAFIALPQVRNGTGYSRTRARTADAVIASVWPSRGLYLTGVEIKVSRSDWRRELADADKSDHIQKYCRYWYVAAPKDIIPVAEVPATWGLIEVETRGCKIVKAAPQLEPVPIDMLLLCSILRNAMEGSIPKSEVNQTIADREKQIEEATRKQCDWDYREIREKVAAFEKASGVELGSRWECGDIGEAVKLVIESKHLQMLQTAKQLAHFARQINEKAESIIAKIGTAFETEEDFD